MIGRTPRFIPMWINIWETKIIDRPEAKSLGKLVSDVRAIFNIRQIRREKRINKIATPKNPISSAIAEKTKSVWGKVKKPY